MSCCNCGCNSNPCKNLNLSDIGTLDYISGFDENGCPKAEARATLIPVVHPAATLTNNAAPFTWNGTTQTGNIPQVGKLVANADGSYTYTAGDGSAPVIIPKECCPTMAMAGNTVTFTNGDGSVITFTLHPAATFAQTAAPFTWNATTQVGNMPQAPRLVANADGSYTFTAGDGSAPVVIPEDCCPTMTLAGNVVTFTNGNGSVVTFTLHPAATLTNNAAAFSWNSATQTGNIPQSPTLALTATGFTFTPGNGGAAVNYIEPVDTDTFVSGFTIVGNVATITRNDGVIFTQNLPVNVDINVQSFSLSGSTLTLTETDGTVHTVTIPAEVKVSAVSFVPATGMLTVTNSDGTTATTTLNVCAALQALPDGAVGTAGVTQVLGKDCQWRTLPAIPDPVVADGVTITGDGSAATPFVAGNLTQDTDKYVWTAADASTFNVPKVGVRRVSSHVGTPTFIPAPATGTVLNVNNGRIDNPSSGLPMIVQVNFAVTEAAARQVVAGQPMNLGFRTYITTDLNGTVAGPTVLPHGTHLIRFDGAAVAPVFFEQPMNVWFEVYSVPPGGYLDITFRTDATATGTIAGEQYAMSKLTMFGVNTEL